MEAIGRAIRVVGPGLLLAATGVGAGDLATSGFAGSELGLGVLWAVGVGAVFKFVLNEQLARWQIATGTTAIEGAARRVGVLGLSVFLLYFLFWSFATGAALISATGVATQALFPLFESPERGKVVFGIAGSLIGLAFVWFGGFRAFERLMLVLIGVMFVTVVGTAVLVGPDLGAFARGLLVPTIPDKEGSLTWIIALIGGVGGTVTILCYGYWMREEGRTSDADLRTSRVDLAFAYLFTALFGMAMIVIATGMEAEGKGLGLIVSLADRLEETGGAGARWLFLVGAFAAIYSSLLGVWQAVPYLFADLWSMVRDPSRGAVEVSTKSVPYRLYLVGLALVPMLGLAFEFKGIQLAYAVSGALFVPVLALVLLTMTPSSALMGDRLRTRRAGVVGLLVVLVFFVIAGVLGVCTRLGIELPW